MLTILNRANIAINKSDLLPIRTNFHFYGNRVQAQNEKICIDSTLPESLGISDITVNAEKFKMALSACNGQVKYTLTDGGKLAIKNGGFKAVIAMSDHNLYPKLSVDGAILPLGGLLPILTKLQPFISENANQLWATGVLFRDGWAYATDNTVLARVKLESVLKKDIVIPSFAIDMIIKIGVEPDRILLSKNRLTFVYADFWMSAMLLTSDWPDISKHFTEIKELPIIPSNLKDSVDKIAPFSMNQKSPIVIFTENGVCTEEGEHNASVSGIQLPIGKYSASVLQRVLNQATHANFDAYPNSIRFHGAGIDGVFVGLRE